MADASTLLGRPVAKAINEATSEISIEFASKHDRPPRLAVLASPDPSGQSYLKTIRITAKKVSAEVVEIPVNPKSDLMAIQREVFKLNDDPLIDGILVQEPLPDGVKLEEVGRAIDQTRDVDGITPYQSGLLFRGSNKALLPPTARAIFEILDFSRIGLKGKEVVVLGRSLVVGKPAGILALGRHATLTWCHSRTQSLAAICKRAEVLIVAIGRARMVNEKFIRPSATVIDVGINVDDKGKLCGDVDTESIISTAGAYTPVPGGVGPVTTACLFDNLLKAANYRFELKS